MWIETSQRLRSGLRRSEFIRQQWRMWIETVWVSHQQVTSSKFIRQQWRMWIETMRLRVDVLGMANSFASNGECGLKQAGVDHVKLALQIHSPAMANVD